jgi:Amt family ammonium transporter
VGVLVAEQFGGAGLAEGMTISSQLGVQAIGVVAVLAWTAIATFIILLIVKAICGLRVDEQEETQGLDISQHEETGYNM